MYSQFYKDNCMSVNFRTFSSIVSQVYTYMDDPKCPVPVKLRFGEWLFKKVYMMYKPPSDKLDAACSSLSKAIEKCNKMVPKANYLQYHNIDALNFLALYFYLHRFEDHDTYFILQLLNDVQLVKNFVQSAVLDDEQLKSHFLSWISQCDVYEQKSNLLDVLLKYYPRDPEVRRIYKEMQKGDNIYTNEQNVHDEDLSVSVISAMEKLMEWDRKNPAEIPPNISPAEYWYGYLKSRFPSNRSIECVIERAKIDTTTFGPSGSTIYMVLFALLNYIKKSPKSRDILEVLKDELVEGKELCSSRYISAFINSLQGFDDNFSITIPFSKQLSAILSIKLAADLNKASEEVQMGSYDPEYLEAYLKFVTETLNKYLPQISKDYGEDDVRDTIGTALKGLTGHSKWTYANGKLSYTI